MWKRLWTLVAIYVLYLVFGTTIFLYLEADNEKELRLVTLNSSSLQKILAALNGTNFTRLEIFRALRKFHYFSTPAEHTLGYNTSFVVNYLRSIFFSLTLISTIGYGNVAPSSPIGQVCSIIYGILGIPLHIILMMLLGNEFKNQIEKLENFFKDRFPRLKYSSLAIRVSSVLFGLFLFLVAPALLFIQTENWSFLEGLYYSFITLATVGLGDYVAGNSQMPYGYYWAYLLLLLIWVVFGLAFLTVIFGVLYGWMQSLVLYVNNWINKLDLVPGKPLEQVTMASERNVLPTFSSVSETADAPITVSVFDESKPGNSARRRVMNLTEDDEITTEHLELLDSMIEELETQYVTKMRMLELKRTAILINSEINENEEESLK